MTSNNTTHSFFRARHSHQHPSEHSTASRFFQNKKICNYIRQYFAVDQVFNIPEISIASFYQKIHKLRSLIVENHQNIFQFMQTSYPFFPILTLNQKICPGYLQVRNNIEHTDTARFSFLQNEHQGTKSLYFGELVNGNKTGYAVYAEYSMEKGQNYSLTSFYQGFFEENAKQGFGMEWKEHSIYLGDFSKGKSRSNEISVILYQTGDIYVGGVNNNKKQGKGTFFKLKKKLNQYYKYQTSRKPLDYEYIVVGLWQNDSITKNSDYLMKKNIQQLLQMNLFDIETNLFIHNHSIYCGDLTQKTEVTHGKQTNFLRDGRGIEYFANGDLYQGEYSSNKPHGHGQYYWSSQEQYMGQFQEGLRSGNGRWVGSNGEQFQGQYKQDKRNGYGIYKWPNGDIYEGEFRDDIRNGLGRMSWHNGQTYVGHWQNGLQHGAGQIQVQLRCTSLHKKFIFDRGNPIIKKQESEEPQSDSLMKSKFQYKHRVKELKEQRRTSYKKDHQRHKTEPKQAQKVRGKSLGELKISKKLKLMQEQGHKHKTEHKSASIIDKSFLDYRKQLTRHQSWQKATKKQTQIEADRAIPTFELKCQSRVQHEDQNNTHNGQIKLTEPTQINQQQYITRNLTQQLNHSKKAIFKKKHLFKQRKPAETNPPLGDTLLKPIKWVNFKESWERN